MNLVLWLEIPDELAENKPFMDALNGQAQNTAADLGKVATTRHVVESSEKPYHKLVAWDLAPRS
jgi:hypothetical protein